MKKNIKFNYCIDDNIKYKNVIDTKERLENIQNTPNCNVYIDYRLALKSIVIFEKFVANNVKAEITIINLHDEILETYKNIFNFIAKGGNLVYHYGGIVKKYKPETARRLANKREVLSDVKQIWHECIVMGIPNYEEEQKICSLIFAERERLKLFVTVSLSQKN